MSFGSADRPLVTGHQDLWRRPPVLELTTARLVTAVDTGDIGFECRDLAVTTANDRRLLDEMADCQQRQYTSGAQSAPPTMAAANHLWASKGETQMCTPLLVLNMGKFAGGNQVANRFLADFPGDHSRKSS
jgi:hypothetical protein